MDFFNVLFNRRYPGAKRGDLSDMLLGDYTTPVQETISGAIAHFTTGKAYPLDSLIASIDPVQDLHGQDSPYPPGGGKNLLPEATIETVDAAGVTVTISADGSITLNGTATTTGFIRVAFPHPLPIGEYTWAWFNNSTQTLQLSLRDEALELAGGWNSANAVNRTFSFTSDAVAYYWQIQIPVTTYDNFTCHPMLVAGATAPTAWTPYSNICPITGHTGVNVYVRGGNLLDNSTFVKGRVDNGQIGYESGTDSVTTTDDEVTFTTNVGYRGVVSGLTRVLGNTQYKFECTRTNEVYPYIDYYDENGTWVSRLAPFATTFTTPTNCVYIRVSFQKTAEGTATVSNLLLSLATYPTTYEPYQGQTYDITFPTEAGTVYGGTLDVVSGVLTVDRAILDASSVATWTNIIDLADGTGRYAYKNDFFPTNQRNETVLCNSRTRNENVQWENLTFGEFRASTTLIVTVPSSVTSNALAVQYFQENPTYFCYELATPITIQLTPQEVRTLLGTNNIWSDSGDTQVTYMRIKGNS